MTAPAVERSRFRNTVTTHDATTDGRTRIIYGDRVDATLALEDGRSVQVGVLADGRVFMRAWAAEPYATDNREACSISFTLPTLEDMVLDGAQVSALSMRTFALGGRSLASPEEHEGTWYYATQAIKTRVEAIKTLLALRLPTPTQNG